MECQQVIDLTCRCRSDSQKGVEGACSYRASEVTIIDVDRSDPQKGVEVACSIDVGGSIIGVDRSDSLKGVEAACSIDVGGSIIGVIDLWTRPPLQSKLSESC